MKTNRKQYSVWAGLLLGTAVGAYAVPVTFEVDMGYRSSQGQFNTDGTDHVEVQSGFNGSGWSGHLLTNVPSTTLYQNTFDITTPASGSVVEYKFHTYGIHDNWEGLGWYPNGNRRFTLGSSAQILPSAYYADQWAGGPGIDVMVQVDMTAQLGVGNFDPAVDTIEAQGPFNNSWSTLTLTNDPSASNTNIYSQVYTETVRPPGTRIEYKFHISGTHAAWESLGGYPDNNRSFMLTNVSPQVLPVAFFSDAAGLPIKAGIYFQVDLSSQILITAFDPTKDLASVRGDALGWDNPPASGLQLFADTSRPGIYTNTYLSASQLTGAAFVFKNTLFRVSPPYTTWEDGANKSVTFTGSEPTNAAGYHMITVGPTLFNNFLADTNDYLPADTLVTFSVSMTNAQSYPAFTPAITFDKLMPLHVNGNWVPWWGWNTAAPVSLLMTNGTGDDWIFSQTVLIPKGKPVRLAYKYGIDDLTGVSSQDNEAPTGSDRIRYIRQTGSYTLPLDTFGVQTVETSFGSLTVGTPSAGHLPVSWSGRPGVFLQTAPALNNGAWVTLPESANYGSPSGIYSTNYPTSAGATFFRLVKP